jgi:hypothetical protein
MPEPSLDAEIRAEGPGCGWGGHGPEALLYEEGAMIPIGVRKHGKTRLRRRSQFYVERRDVFGQPDVALGEVLADLDQWLGFHANPENDSNLTGTIPKRSQCGCLMSKVICSTAK